MTKRIVVTQKDIDKGNSGNPYSCPVSLALTRGFKKATSVAGSAGWRFTENRIYFCLPVKVATFVRQFDCGYKVKPFQFNVTI